jgi:hypothetical protein
VTLSIGFADVPEFPPAFRDESRQEALRLMDRTLGERWSVTQSLDPSLPRSAEHLTLWTNDAVPIPRLTPRDDEAPAFPADSAPDKFLCVVVAPHGAGFVVAAREWDRLTDSLGAVRSAATSTRKGIPSAALAAMRMAFRDVAAIGPVEGETAVMLLLAADIPAPDPVSGLVPVGTLFVPHLRRFDREGTLEEVRPVPHTLLRIAEVTAGGARAEVQSALRSPLGTRRGRVEAWAISAEPAAASTRLTLVRREDGVPLPGRVVEVRSDAFRPGVEQPPPDATLLTDRSGSIVLDADPARPLVWLTVKSGEAVLIRLPLAPGIEPSITLPLGDDARRIDTEGRLAVLTGELVETVAKRATLLAKARSGARSGKYEEADAALAEAAKLPDVAEYRRRLAAVEAATAKAAEEAGDRLAAARIRALGRKTSDLIERYLNPDALRAMREEVEELKRTDPDRK